MKKRETKAKAKTKPGKKQTASKKKPRKAQSKPAKKTTPRKAQSKPAKKTTPKKGTSATSKQTLKQTSKTTTSSAKNTVPVGRTVLVRNGHINKRSKKPNDRRTHVVIEINNEDLALVRITEKKPNTTQLKYYQDGESFFKHFVEIEDVKKQPLRVGEDITQNHKNMDVRQEDVDYIRNTISNSKRGQRYKRDMKKFRDRYKEKKPTLK